MTLFKSKGGTEKPPVVWFVVERAAGGGFARAVATRADALADFTERLHAGTGQDEPFTPYERRRRLLVIGPDAVTLPDSFDDPLLVGDVALKAVLTPDEYQLYVHGPVATALLES